MVSDIFTEKAQFHWMLHTFLELGRNHPPEDELLHQFLSLGVSKAAAVLGQVQYFKYISHASYIIILCS
jgi:hypothetical protein